MSRCLSTLLLPVAWTTAVASCTKSPPFTFVLFSQCSTLQRVWSLKSGNATSSQLFETIYTVCSCVNERTLRSVYSSTNAFTMQLAPPYLVSLLTPVTAISARRHLPSADLGYLTTPRTRTVAGFGPRSFSAAGPSAWNSLPSELKNTSLTVG